MILDALASDRHVALEGDDQDRDVLGGNALDVVEHGATLRRVGLNRGAADEVVQRGIAVARRIAKRRLSDVISGIDHC